MKVRMLYRVHMKKKILQPQQVVDMDEKQALDLIHSGAAEKLENKTPDTQKPAGDAPPAVTETAGDAPPPVAEAAGDE